MSERVNDQQHNEVRDEGGHLWGQKLYECKALGQLSLLI